MSGVHELVVEQRLPIEIAKVFAFFEDAGNLEAITPPFLNFSILTPRPIDMRAGAQIDYKLRIRGVPAKWRTRITAYDPPHRFVDEQERGPYRLWRHEHTFKALGPNETLIHDRVQYELPRVPGRSIVHALIVRPDLEKIFEYRKQAIERILLGDRGGASRASAAPRQPEVAGVR